MTEEVQTQEDERKRTLYTAIISYNMPSGGMVQVAAYDLEHAKELVNGISEELTDVKIIDLFPANQAPELPQEMPEGDNVVEGNDEVH